MRVSAGRENGPYLARGYWNASALVSIWVTMGMKPRHQVSKAAVELIKKFEGYRSKAAQLPDGRWTIGFGHTLTAREGAQVSEQDAEALLLYDLIAVAHVVNEHTFTPLTQNQFDALCCFAFNIGLDGFKRSSVLRRVNEGSLLQAACAMEMWRKADFEGERIVVDALVRRRSAEKTLFLTPAGGWVPAPSPIVRPKVDYDAVNAIPRQTPTALKAPMTGDKAVVEREAPRAEPAGGVIPLASSAVLSAADLVGAKLAQIVPEPTPRAGRRGGAGTCRRTAGPVRRRHGYRRIDDRPGARGRDHRLRAAPDRRREPGLVAVHRPAGRCGRGAGD